MLKMKHLLLLFITIGLLSCNNEKILELPEINYSSISKIDDISAAYLFYNSEKDSIELNRKNLISTTNWLVNVDKRLSLKLAIPQITFLQNKKKNAGHKKEDAKNYFTCNDMSLKTLGFIEFTETVYHQKTSLEYLAKLTDLNEGKNTISIAFDTTNTIAITEIDSSLTSTKTNINNLLVYLKKQDSTARNIYLNFNEDLKFQDYITYKSLIEKADLKESKISNNEFIFN
ncbi:hypothetical protein DFQ06_1556 [Algibacter lectus]|uniref:Lipoprotein n=2 Tax=Algibacter lectus TaxID=221126 RepID=A0A4R8MFD4_9FLAO|nr:hypothetical protein DFQ06_1556 [Algibacter lectus]